jgi:hypothetical protein
MCELDTSYVLWYHLVGNTDQLSLNQIKRRDTMSTVTPKELLQLWTLEKVTAEMAIGHIIQNLVKAQTSAASRDTSLYKLRSDVDDLLAHTGITPRSRTMPRSKNKKAPHKG